MCNKHSWTLSTEEHSISGWVNRQEKDLKIKMPDTLDKVESFNK